MIAEAKNGPETITDMREVTMNQASRTRYMTTVARGVLALAAPAVVLMAGSASAEAAGSQTAPAVQAASVENGGRLEEVLVTARKREESVQKVPIAISAVRAS